MLISETTLSIFIGVVSGIITAFFLWLLNLGFKKIMLPWFEEFVYKGVDVTGNWIHKIQDSAGNQILEIRLELEQNAHNVYGKFQAKTNWPQKKEEYVNYYKLNGTVKDNYLLFTYTAIRKDRTGMGSFLLRVSHGGTELVGSSTFTPDGNKNDAEVASRTDMVFFRN